MKAKEFIIEYKKESKPRNFVAKNAKMGGAGQHKDKKKAEKQGDVKHKKNSMPMETALRDKEDYYAKRKALDDLGRNKDVDQKAVQQRRLDLDKEARQKGVAEGLTTEKQILTRIRQIMYDRKLSGTESNAGELLRLKQQLKDLRSQQDVAEGNVMERDREDDEGWGSMNKNEFKRRELQHELGHEKNNLQVSINGRPWKVFPGRGYADSQEERSYLRSMQSWAEKKSAATGKKWTVSLTGLDPS